MGVGRPFGVGSAVTNYNGGPGFVVHLTRAFFFQRMTRSWLFPGVVQRAEFGPSETCELDHDIHPHVRFFGAEPIGRRTKEVHRKAVEGDFLERQSITPAEAGSLRERLTFGRLAASLTASGAPHQSLVPRQAPRHHNATQRSIS